MTTWIFGALFGFGVGCLVGVFVCWYQDKLKNDAKRLHDALREVGK